MNVNGLLQRHKRFLLILSVYAVSRIVILLFFFDTVYGGDEQYIGLISKNLMSSIIPAFDFPSSPRVLSELLPAFFLLPFISVFGTTYLSLKLFALCVSCIDLSVWYLVIDRASRKAALFFALLSTAAPAIGLNASLMVFPGHYSASLPIGVCALFLLTVDLLVHIP
jgi:hypothetical protein